MTPEQIATIREALETIRAMIAPALLEIEVDLIRRSLQEQIAILDQAAQTSEPSESMAISQSPEDRARALDKFLAEVHERESGQGEAERSALWDAFEAGYMQGHNDTVESCVRDSKDAASDYFESMPARKPESAESVETGYMTHDQAKALREALEGMADMSTSEEMGENADALTFLDWMRAYDEMIDIARAALASAQEKAC